MLQCKAKVQGGRYTDARLIVPPLEGFEVRAERLQAPNLGAGSSISELEWRVLGDGWFGGDDDKAIEWLRNHGAIEFVDPNGVRWRKDWQGSLLELTPEYARTTVTSDE